jgi:hypothetical protein
VPSTSSSAAVSSLRRQFVQTGDRRRTSRRIRSRAKHGWRRLEGGGVGCSDRDARGGVKQ